MRKSKKISFCVTSCNRLWQLRQTLQSNLNKLRDDFEITLVDYGSSDGLSDWIWGNFGDFIKFKKLVFFEVKNKVSWNVSKAKNLAHRISNGDYLVNLDADNFVGDADINLILKARSKGVSCHQWSNDLTDGSFGRICLTRDLFFKLGGYDESLLPMGGQDVDLLRRIVSIGSPIVRIDAPEITAIKNSMEDKVSEINKSNSDAISLYSSINKLNLYKSKTRLAIEGPVITGGFSSYKGLLNGVEVIIDGFNLIRTTR